MSVGFLAVIVAQSVARGSAAAAAWAARVSGSEEIGKPLMDAIWVRRVEVGEAM